MKDRIKILITDDHQMIIDGIRNLLRKEDKFWVVGEAKDGLQAQAFLKGQEVDLLITDIQMPNMDGMELTTWVKEKLPSVKVLVLSMYQEQEVIRRIFQANAEGYLLKNTSRQQLKEAIEKVVEGGTYYSREVLHNLMGEFLPKGKSDLPAIDLTEREREVLHLIAAEHTSSEIAEQLFISPRTVDTHRKHLLQKTSSRSVVGLIKYGLKAGLLHI
ncbi:MAG: response regulator transcription factor [Bacteroidota bacterium]